MSNTTPDQTPQVLLAPIRAALVAQQPNTLEVLVRVQAPDAPLADPVTSQAQRSLALVIDASGSMQGRPLEEAKRCAEMVVSRLHAADRLAVVQFDQDARLLWPAVEVGDARALTQAIQSIQPGGSTALHDGWLLGVKTLSSCPVDGLRRVILLSDGEANRGERNPIVIAAQCAEWANQGITTSTYGLGASFNEDLMVAMAERGGGNQYFGQTADDLMAPFEQELSLIDSRCLSDVRVSFRAPAGITVDVLNELPVDGGIYRLPDLAYGSETWALLRLTVPTWVLEGGAQGAELLQVQVSGRSRDGSTMALEPVQLRLPTLARDAWLQTPVDELVQRRVTEVAAAQALDNMRALMRQGDVQGVTDMIRAARQEFASSEWVLDILNSMEQMLQDSQDSQFVAKEMRYSSSSLKFQLRARQESDRLMAAEEAPMPAFLRRKGRQGIHRS